MIGWIRLLSIWTLVAAVVSGCQKAENIKASATKPEKPLVGYFGNVNTNRQKVVHLYKDTVYTLSEFFVRFSGEELVIDEGTLIKATTEGSSLGITIEPGGVIVANGTAANPIVFTSADIPGVQARNWGGLIINGKAKNNNTNPNGDPTDFSGSLNYVRVEFAGLTLNSVGDRTIVDNVQVSYCNDKPSFQVDGGSFNAKHLVSYACAGPADFYITRGYTGMMQNILAYRHPFFGRTGSDPANSLAGVFIENNPSIPVGTVPNTSPVISNLTVLGPEDQNGSTATYSDTFTRAAALVTTNNAQFQIANSVFAGFPVNGWYLDDASTASSIDAGPSSLTYSVVQCRDTSRAFYLAPGTYPPFTSDDFRVYLLHPEFHNRLFDVFSNLSLLNPFDYDGNPNPLPHEKSFLQSGAGFEGVFTNPFFTPVQYVGAFGEDNWMQGWTNFKPLKTNYNVGE